MKNNTNQMLFMSKILLGIALGFSIIIFLLNMSIYIWGYLNPDIFDKGFWPIDLKEILNQSIWLYVGLGILNGIYALLFALLFMSAITTIDKLNLKKPFNEHLHERIKTMAVLIVLLALAKIGIEKLTNIHTEQPVINLEILEGQLFTFSIGCIFYVLSLVVKKGLEIQNENEFTI